MDAIAVHYRVMFHERRSVLRRIASRLHRLFRRAHQTLCALRGHNLMLAFAPDRLSLRCTACGFHTPGWQLDVRFPSVARQPQVRVTTRATPVVLTPRRSLPAHTSHCGKAA